MQCIAHSQQMSTTQKSLRIYKVDKLVQFKPRQLHESWSRWQRPAALSSRPLPCSHVLHDRVFALQAYQPSFGPSCEHEMLRIVSKCDTYFNCEAEVMGKEANNVLAKMFRNVYRGCILPRVKTNESPYTVTRYPNPNSHKHSA